MAFSGVQVRSTLNGITPVNGYRDDMAIADTVGLALTNTLGMSTFRWELVGRPEGSSAGGSGPEPILLGTSATASFVVDSDAPYHRDGTYVVQCTVNQGTPTETRIRALLVRLTGLSLADGRVLRKLGGFEAVDDNSIATIFQGWATQVNRWLEFIRANAGSCGCSSSPPSLGLVQWVKADAGVTVAATRVSNWADQSGHSQDFVQANAGNKPYLLGDSIDGIPLITFGVAGDANKSFATAANFQDRFGADMDGNHARTVLTVIKPRFDGAFARTGGPLWSENSWVTYFFLDPTGVVGPVNGAYAWSDAGYGTANQFTPVSGGSGGPYDGVPTLTEYFSAGRPDLEFRINDAPITLAPTTMHGAAGGSSPASLSDSSSLAFLGGVSEVLVYDYDLRTDSAAYAAVLAYLRARYPSITI